VIRSVFASRVIGCSISIEEGGDETTGMPRNFIPRLEGFGL